jgi:hypothetical protein
MSFTPAQRSVLEKLERFDVTASALGEAERLFADAGDAARARWMALERSGYGSETGAHNLREIVGAGFPSDVLESIVRGRLRYGRLRLTDDGPVVGWPHFFVEGIDVLRDWRNRVAHAAHGSTIVVELKTQDPSYPRALTFPDAVFVDVFRAITMEVADAVRRAEVS